MVFWCLFDTKKAPIRCLFSTTFGELFLVYSLGKYTRFLVTHPLLAWGWGQKLAKFAVFLVAKILKMHIFDLLNGYIHPNNFKKQKTSPWGFAPNPTLTCEAAGAGGKPYPPTPTVSVGSIQGVKGKMHDFVALDPSPSPWG